MTSKQGRDPPGPSQSNFQSIWINFKSFLTILRPILGPVFHISSQFHESEPIFEFFGLNQGRTLE